MDDLNKKIADALSDPETLSQLQSLASMLGESSPGLHNEVPSDTSPNPAENRSGVSNGSPLDALLGSLPKPAAPNSLSALSPEMLSMMMKLSPLLANFSQDDNTTRLLAALRPFLSDERKSKLDEAGKLLRMMKLLPLLKDFSIF